MRSLWHILYIYTSHSDLMEGANSHSYCVFKVCPVTREFDPKLRGRKGCTYPPLRTTRVISAPADARTGVSMLHARTHVHSCVFRCESIIVRSFDVHHRRRTSKAHGYFSQSSAEYANGISFDAALFALSYYRRYVLSLLYIRIFRRNRKSNDMLFAAEFYVHRRRKSTRETKRNG